MTTELTTSLNGLLANYTVFYQKVRNYHWTVRGPAFFQLHVKFEEMYLFTAEQVDLMAERVLALGAMPIATLARVLEAATLAEDSGEPNANQMVTNLRNDMAVLVAANGEAKKLAEGDDTTTNLLDDLTDALEKDRWMLGAWLG